MTCPECVHAVVCEYYAKSLLEFFDAGADEKQELLENCRQDEDDVCEHFLASNRVVELPCKVGGDCFFVNQNGTIQRATLERVYMFSTSTELFLNDGREIYSTSLNESNIELFPTYEAAEQALKERENNEG